MVNVSFQKVAVFLRCCRKSGEVVSTPGRIIYNQNTQETLLTVTLLRFKLLGIQSTKRDAFSAVVPTVASKDDGSIRRFVKIVDSFSPVLKDRQSVPVLPFYVHSHETPGVPSLHKI